MSKTKQDKREVTFASGASVPGGTVIYLTGAQAHARGHLVRPLKDGHKSIKDAKRLPFVGEKPVFFKAGETVELEGEIDRGVALAIGEEPAPGTPAKTATKPAPDRDENGDTPEMAQMRKQFDAAYAKARTNARRELLDEIEKRNDAIDAEETAADALAVAEEALAAGAEAEKPALQATVDEAKTALDAAKAAVAALPPIAA